MAAPPAGPASAATIVSIGVQQAQPAATPTEIAPRIITVLSLTHAESYA